MDHAQRLDRTVLVVDDDVFLASAIAELLVEDGYDVHTATNGFSAWRRVSELRPAVLLLDLALPERSGQDVLHDLRSDPATRDMAIVVVTGFPEALSETQLAETDGLVAKPFDERDLRLTVQHAIQLAATRRAEVAPIAAVPHPARCGRVRGRPGARRTRGRR
jgi:CheY-like chemotaxis protein